MSRPKFFRDPIHLQIRFAPADLRESAPKDDAEKRQSWLLRKLIDAPEFQRLRFIRQNGLVNLVFHGAEHSRFNHSIGVMYLARTMYKCMIRNMDEVSNPEQEMCVSAAALLHDVGHGPFSHTLEEILKDLKVEFHHEQMTVRFLLENTNINKMLSEIDPGLPKAVAAFIDHKLRPEDNWRYKLVSSQLDADRLDYLLRDAYFCGLKGGFDLMRILDLLQHNEGRQIGVDEGGLEAVEAYLVTLDQLYRAIYYHHAVRAASTLLNSTIKRAIRLSRGGDKTIFRWRSHPLRQLAEKGSAVDLAEYESLGEHHLWVLIDEWRRHKDPILSDLAERVRSRRLFKSIQVSLTSHKEFKEYNDLINRAKEITKKVYPHVDDETVEYYVCEDAPERTSYKPYNWKSESLSDTIWIMSQSGKSRPIEDEDTSSIIQGLKKTHYFPRLMMTEEVRELLQNT